MGKDSALQQQNAISIPSKKVLQQDSSLHLVNGVYYYHNQLYSGTIENYFSTTQLQSIQTFYNGKEEGWLQTFYPDGKKKQKDIFITEKKTAYTKAGGPMVI